MLLRLDREESEAVKGSVVTWGDLYVDGEHAACTLEDEVREVPGRHVMEWKVAKRTAIPTGFYRVYLDHSPKFGPYTITLDNVPGFTYVRIHGGTDVEDTEGCPLVGSRQDRLAGTLHGAKVEQRLGGVVVPPVLEALKDRIRDAVKRHEKVFIQVRNAPSWYLERGIAVPKAGA